LYWLLNVAYIPGYFRTTFGIGLVMVPVLQFVQSAPNTFGSGGEMSFEKNDSAGPGVRKIIIFHTQIHCYSCSWSFYSLICLKTLLFRLSGIYF
jgi:hypothetical protein